MNILLDYISFFVFSFVWFRLLWNCFLYILNALLCIYPFDLLDYQREFRLDLGKLFIYFYLYCWGKDSWSIFSTAKKNFFFEGGCEGTIRTRESLLPGGLVTSWIDSRCWCLSRFHLKVSLLFNEWVFVKILIEYGSLLIPDGITVFCFLMVTWNGTFIPLLPLPSKQSWHCPLWGWRGGGEWTETLSFPSINHNSFSSAVFKWAVFDHKIYFSSIVAWNLSYFSLQMGISFVNIYRPVTTHGNSNSLRYIRSILYNSNSTNLESALPISLSKLNAKIM